ncbi:xaa-pro dipeptidase [Lactobacillus hominis DSM 23910 = CRBIP 24.179]|uniref:YigZ family protein n=1 Tax=Lactobacillus hominis TaxID=1203033 RepID=UPI0006F14027|nr:YigZ family protein [Lactobacillus hominis]KRM86260.1 xaa-pro dipeptidase [Lactobacillus hominis DSM 23910 = CRBIP 24.179]MCT3348517.1 YigZ family protein [Lactobacillus hominis]
MSNNKNDFLTIKENGVSKLIIKKSKFICSMARTETEQEAQDFITQISKKYHDATHNTFAYTIGKNDEHVKASDNGEPSGTAGIPELKALQLMNLKNVIAVVTRYFGGIKLGAGGLIRAYSNSVTHAVEEIGVVKKCLQQELALKISYANLDRVNHYLEQNEIYVADREFGAQVTIKVFLDLDQINSFKDELINLLANNVKFTTGKQRYNEISVTSTNYHEQ